MGWRGRLGQVEARCDAGSTLCSEEFEPTDGVRRFQSLGFPWLFAIHLCRQTLGVRRHQNSDSTNSFLLRSQSLWCACDLSMVLQMMNDS